MPEMAAEAPVEAMPEMAAEAPSSDESADIEGFLSDNDYEYVAVTTGNKTQYIVKKAGGTMNVSYEDGEFESFNRNYERNGENTYGGVVFSFVKEAIQGNGCDSLTRHKGTNIN